MVFEPFSNTHIEDSNLDLGYSNLEDSNLRNSNTLFEDSNPVFGIRTGSNPGIRIHTVVFESSDSNRFEPCSNTVFNFAMNSVNRGI